jgi:hypothetical protein
MVANGLLQDFIVVVLLQAAKVTKNSEFVNGLAQQVVVRWLTIIGAYAIMQASRKTHAD